MRSNSLLQTSVRLAGIAMMALTALMVSACRPKNQQPVVPVSGHVLFERKPAERALVVFHPVGGDATTAALPHGEVGPDGRFKLSTFANNDGAPAGEYLVTVEWWLHSGRRGDDSPPANRLPSRYAVAQTSGLRATITNGPTELQPFELKR